MPIVTPSGSADYSIWLLTPTGQLIKLIERYVSVRYVIPSNGIGVLQLKLMPSFDMGLLQEDSQILVYRQLPGGVKYRDADAVWLVRDWEWGVSQRGEETITVLAYSANDLLDRAIVAYAAGSAQASKSSMPVGNMIKALVRENLGSLATDTSRDISTYLLVEPDLDDGPSTSKGMSWRALLPTLKELAQDAADGGSPIYFDTFRRYGSQQLTFATFAGQRGVNHGQASGQRVVLSVSNGSLSEVRWQYQTSTERNYIYVGGQGQEDDRTVVSDGNADRMALSPYNRRELFLDARGTADSGLQAELNAALRNYRPRETLVCKVRDSRAVKFGRDYGYGDIVVVDTKRRITDMRVDAVEITGQNGAETIGLQLKVV